MKEYRFNKSYEGRTVLVTAVRMNLDINGNPRFKVQVWSCLKEDNKTIVHGNIWSPTIKGYRRSKDDTYILKCCFNLEEDLNAFMKLFEETVYA
jgi:hypothetical protein